jgi:hypothetical protein
MDNKKILIALLIGAALVFVASRLWVEPFVELEQPVVELSELDPSPSPRQALLNKAMGDIDFYRQMTVGSRFALQLGVGNSDAVVEIVVTGVRVEGSAVLIEGGSSLLEDADGSSSLQDAEGSSSLQDAEGSSSLQDAEGSSSLQDAEGSLQDSEGASLLEDADGSLPADGSMLMTVGEKFIHVFLTLDSGIYEYSGKDFQGVVSRTKELRFNNDTAVLPNQSFELTDQPPRQRAVPAEIAQ